MFVFCVCSFIVELSDKAFGVSNPRYIKRQAEILRKATVTLTEVEQFLHLHDNDETAHMHTFTIARRKYVDLKGNEAY